MATPQELTITGDDLALAARQGRRDPTGEREPHLSGEMLPDVWKMEDLQFRPKPNWLINGMVEEKGLTIFFGPDKVGKTAMLSSFLWAWSGKKDWFLHEEFKMSDPSDSERSVLYVLLEGQAAFYDRYDAWKNVYNSGDPIENFYVIDEGLSLFDKNMRWDDVKTWTTSAAKLYNAISELKPSLLVVDTLSRATAGMDENSPQMAQVVGFLDYLRDTEGTSTILVHHVALADGDRPRGHSSLKGAASSYVRIEGKPEDHVLFLKHGPHRNAESGTRPYGFTRNTQDNAFVVTKEDATRKVLSKEYEVVQLVSEKGPLSITDVTYQLYGEINTTKVKYLKGVVDRSEALSRSTEPGSTSIVALSAARNKDKD